MLRTAIEMSDRSGAAPYGALYALLVALHAVPFWTVERVPTMDGPSHVYNGWLLGRLLAGDLPWFERVFAVRWEPVPNWLAAALLGLGSALWRPETAEKLLLTLYVGLLGWALWAMCGARDRRRAWLAFLVLPWVFNLALDAGFYSFAIGLAGFAGALALGAPVLRGERGLGALNGVLGLTYFAHLVPHLAALGVLAAAWLRGGRRPQLALRLFAPQLLLPWWFVWRQRGHDGGTLVFEADRLQSMARFDLFLPWRSAAPLAAAGLAALLWLLTALALWRAARRGWRARCAVAPAEARPSPSFVVGVVFLAVVLVCAPESALGGSVLPLRLGILAVLCLGAAIEPPSGRWAKRAAVLAAAGLSLLGIGATTARYREGERETRQAIAVARRVPRRATFVSLVLPSRPPAPSPRLFHHVDGYAAVERKLVELSNHQADSDFFPVSFRPDVVRPGVQVLAARPAEFDLTALRPAIDAVIVHGDLPRGKPLTRSLRTHYRRVARSGAHAVWLRLETGAAPAP